METIPVSISTAYDSSMLFVAIVLFCGGIIRTYPRNFFIDAFMDFYRNTKFLFCEFGKKERTTIVRMRGQLRLHEINHLIEYHQEIHTILKKNYGILRHRTKNALERNEKIMYRLKKRKISLERERSKKLG